MIPILGIGISSCFDEDLDALSMAIFACPMKGSPVVMVLGIGIGSGVEEDLDAFDMASHGCFMEWCLLVGTPRKSFIRSLGLN